MHVIYPDRHGEHRPDRYFVRGNAVEPREVPERADVLLEAARRAGHTVVTAGTHDGTWRKAVHDPAYLDFLARAHERWRAMQGSSPQVMTSIHPGRRMHGFPSHVVGQAGWFIADTSCPIGPGTWAAACCSADAAVDAAALVAEGHRTAYALCRPPGHHCFGDLAGGFCYLNNAAIATEYLRQVFPRVAIIDIDVHHGNGTQGIYYERGDVFFGSVHADPAEFYPFFAGYAEERGNGEGNGATRNIPLPLGSGDGPFLDGIRALLAEIARFDPPVLVVSLGLDASRDDPFAGLAVTTDGFAEAGRLVADLDRPLVLIQEGGYVSPSLGDNLTAFLGAAEAG